MQKLPFVSGLLIAVLFCVSAAAVRSRTCLIRYGRLLSASRAISLEFRSLADSEIGFNPTPWVDPPGNTTQVFPLFLGASPRELAGGLPEKATPRIPAALQPIAQAQASWLAAQLNEGQAQFEAWPAEGDDGQWTWVFSRWRKDAQSPWQWLSERDWGEPSEETIAPPILPKIFNPNKGADNKAIFADQLEMDGLYDVPEFSHLVWTTKDGQKLLGAWLPAETRQENRKRLTKPGVRGYSLPPPARLNGAPHAFLVTAKENHVSWDQPIEWQQPEPLPKVDRKLVAGKWPDDFLKKYKERVYQLAGEKDLVFPISGKKVRITNRSSALPDNDLEVVNDYLQEFYQSIGVETVRLPFEWEIGGNTIKQSVVVAILPGEKSEAPVLGFDHTDAAFAENIFRHTGERVPVEGASDNLTATAALMAAAEQWVARRKAGKPKLKNTIFLVHVPGEEFPGDDLGARKFLTALLTKDERLKGARDSDAVLIPDYIGYHLPGKRLFRISPARTEGSMRLAALMLDATQKMFRPKRLRPVLELPDDPKNATYQTDLAVTARYGMPGVLVNQVDYSHNKGRVQDPRNHQDTDTAPNVKYPYATDVSKVWIETLFRAADSGGGDE